MMRSENAKIIEWLVKQSAAIDKNLTTSIRMGVSDGAGVLRIPNDDEITVLIDKATSDKAIIERLKDIVANDR